MNTHVRTFEDRAAVRSQVPLLLGLMGPSGSGKTFSALRLATGIQRVAGGEIFFIDTESKRALHYAEQFKFRHIEFGAPFGSLDYLAALQHCVAKGAGVIVVDSMTHEHVGMGGYLLTQEAEIDRMAGDDYAKRERVKMAGWIKPAKLRQQFITGLLQLNSNFIFCFRAKEKTKPVPGKQPVEMGFMPIAGEELLFEMTLNCLLLPKAGGVPTWRSDHIGERLMMKCPMQFEGLFANEKPLDEDIGVALAAWARGGANATDQVPDIALSANDLRARGDQAAARGLDVLREFWTALSKANKAAVGGVAQLDAWKRIAAETETPDIDFDDGGAHDKQLHESAAEAATNPPATPPADAASANLPREQRKGEGVGPPASSPKNSPPAARQEGGDAAKGADRASKADKGAAASVQGSAAAPDAAALRAKGEDAADRGTLALRVFLRECEDAGVDARKLFGPPVVERWFANATHADERAASEEADVS